MARKKRKIKTYSFLIVPDSKDNPKNFTLSVIAVRSLFILGIVIITLIILGATTYWKVADVAIDYSRLQEENFELRSSLKSIETMKEELSFMKNANEKIRKSLSGYVQVENIAENDTVRTANLNFELLAPEKKRTIFNFIPSVMPVKGYITRGFETEDLSANPHYGLDIAAEKGSPIMATADGTVIFSEWTYKSGYVLIIKHNYGYLSAYKHNQRNLVSLLEKVEKGQVIALVGDTGEVSSGAHVHFEIWNEGNPQNPLAYVDQKN